MFVEDIEYYFMHLSIINVFKKSIAKSIDGIEVQLMWQKVNGHAFICEAISDENGQAIICHVPNGKAKIILNNEDFGCIDTPCVHTIIID